MLDLKNLTYREVSFLMAKYSFEMKMEIVKAYLNNEGGYTYLAKKYGIPDKKPVQQWVTSYKAFGEEGLMLSKKKKHILSNSNLMW